MSTTTVPAIKPVDEMTPEELRSALRWETDERKRLQRRLASVQGGALAAIDMLRGAL